MPVVQIHSDARNNTLECLFEYLGQSNRPKHRLKMRYDSLKDLAANPNFVSGIYNYCDRWCERCAFTSRCLLYATEQADPDADDPEVRDITNAKFWRKMHEIFADTAAMISECAAEAGVDLNSVDVSEEMAEHERAIEIARRDQASQEATDYTTEVQRWFNEEFITEELVHTDTPAVEQSETIDIAVGDAAEVIRFYQYFIAVKLMRALSGAVGVPEENFDDDDFLSFDFASSDDEDDEDLDHDEIITRSSVIDANGSAKIALIAIDRSIAAWRSLQISLPEKSETIQPMMIRLDGLRRSIEARFPKARDFIRPGLDELLSDFDN